MNKQAQFNNRDLYGKFCGLCEELTNITDPIMKLAFDDRFEHDAALYEWRRAFVTDCYNYECDAAADLLRVAKFCYDREKQPVRPEDYEDLSTILLGVAKNICDCCDRVETAKDQLTEESKGSEKDFTSVFSMIDCAFERYDTLRENTVTLYRQLADCMELDV